MSFWFLDPPPEQLETTAMREVGTCEKCRWPKKPLHTPHWALWRLCYDCLLDAEIERSHEQNKYVAKPLNAINSKEKK